MRPIPLRSFAALALAVTAPLAAQQAMPTEAPGRPDARRVTAGSYRTDPSHSLIRWEVTHFGFNAYYGLFGDVAGTLELDPRNPAASRLDVTIPVSKVTTVNAALTQHLLRPGANGGRPDFFGPAPADARFVSTAVRASGSRARITGNLTLNGVTRPVTIDARFIGAGTNPFNRKETVGFEGTATIRRSEFGITNGIPLVTDEVKLAISVAFEKQ